VTRPADPDARPSAGRRKDHDVDSAAPPSGLRPRTAWAVCALLLAATCANLLAVVSRKGITTDEVPIIPAAYYHLRTSEFRLVNEHPPLVKILAGSLLLPLKPREFGRAPLPEEQWACEIGFWLDNRADFQRICLRARLPMIALTAALGLLVFLYARDLFGARAALFAVALFCAEPTVLAHGRVVQTDVPAAFGYLLFFFALRRYALAPTARRSAALGVAAGVAAVAKFSMLVCGPVAAAAFAALAWRAPRGGRSRKRLAADLCVAALASLLVVHAAYSFHARALTDSDAAWIAKSFPARAASVMTATRALSHVQPADFVLGALWQLRHNAEGHPASLLGAYSRTGWWYYFPAAFALKTTLPFLLLSLASLAWACREFFIKRERRFFWLLAPFAAYTLMLTASRIDIGVRYYLPAYPFLFVLAGALTDRLIGARPGGSRRAPWRSRFARLAPAAASVALLCWCFVEAARAFPDYVPYMNQLAAGRPHWRLLSDSNVEWGDDVPALVEYLRARGETRVRGAAFCGHFTPRFLGFDYYDVLTLTEAQLPPTRYVAVGASFLNGSPVPLTPPPGRALTEQEMYDFFDAYRRRTPEAVFGGSIYLFREPGR
jgi:hypothetical protein